MQEKAFTRDNKIFTNKSNLSLMILTRKGDLKNMKMVDQ